MILARYNCSSVTEGYQAHSRRTVDCISFTGIPHTNVGVLIATGFLLNNNCLLSSDANRSFWSEVVCSFSSPKKRGIPSKSQTQTCGSSQTQANTELQLAKAHLQRNPLSQTNEETKDFVFPPHVTLAFQSVAPPLIS